MNEPKKTREGGVKPRGLARAFARGFLSQQNGGSRDGSPYKWLELRGAWVRGWDCSKNEVLGFCPSLPKMLAREDIMALVLGKDKAPE